MIRDDNFIHYSGGIKYHLRHEYQAVTGIKPDFRIEHQFFALSMDGVLTLREGYACDGPSGPTLDTPDSIRAAFEHDAFYQMMRLNLLPESVKPQVDKRFHAVMSYDAARLADLKQQPWLKSFLKLRAYVFYLGVKFFGKSSTKPESERAILSAPF